MKNIVKLTKFQSKLAKWLQLAASDDPARGILRGINVQDTYSVTADGYRMHAINQPILDKQGTFDLGKVRAGENIVEPQEVEGKYPDAISLVPAEEPVFEIAVDPTLLIDALKGMPKYKPVRLRFFGDRQPMEVMGKVEPSRNDTEDEPVYVYALIMPMKLEYAPDPWKPE